MTIPTDPDSSQLSSGFQSSRLSLLGSRDIDPIGRDGIDPDCDPGREQRSPERKPPEAGKRPLRVFGVVVYERDGGRWLYDTQRGGMILLGDEGVTMPSTRPGLDLVPWDAIRELRCWAPVAREDRGRSSSGDESRRPRP
jgi:hypothetical protein